MESPQVAWRTLFAPFFAPSFRSAAFHMLEYGAGYMV
jgi:hypothetical protein